MGKWIVAAVLAVLVGAPLIISRALQRDAAPGADLPTLIVVSPHVPQIREEFARAFSAWHERTYGTGVRVDYRVLGGTSEIVRALQARYGAAMEQGEYTIAQDGSVALSPGAVEFDLLFGGGSFDHGRLKEGVSVGVPGREEPLICSMSMPAGFEQTRLDAWFGENAIGAGRLYDPEQYWIGTALSGFGVVYNRDLTRLLLGRDDLSSFEDLADPRLAGWVALADPRQSGSITTTMDSILSVYGWDRGWRTLRAMAANARSFTGTSSKPPIDVSQGECAAGLAIDFYGRSQSQIVMQPGETPETTRVGYVDPVGEVVIDADPVSILRGGPSPELARRFIEFCLSDEGQALWNFSASGGWVGERNPPGPGGEAMGPRRYELRRMPIRREFTWLHRDLLIDRVDPYEAATTTPSAGWRSAIGLMMGAFGVDTHEQLALAWKHLIEARASGAPAELIARAEALIFAWPDGEQVGRHWARLFGDAGTLPTDARLPFTPENYRAIRATWREPGVQSRLAIVYASCFAENYGRAINLLDTDGAGEHTRAGGG